MLNIYIERNNQKKMAEQDFVKKKSLVILKGLIQRKSCFYSQFVMNLFITYY